MTAPSPTLIIPSHQPKGIVVFSGGSAANSLVDVFSTISKARHANLSYIIPISDNGGSSSELIRVFGGPGIGDIRSRLVRLIPDSQSAIAALLNHRLAKNSHEALAGWSSLVSGSSPLWLPISPDTRELLRSMLNHVNFEILKRARPPASTFNFSSASVGNLFLTGARLFTGSFESAIQLLALICGIANEGVGVVPAVNSNFTHHISAGLVNGTVVVGQNGISHPSEPTALNAGPGPSSPQTGILIDEPTEDANLPGSLASLRKAEINFSKSSSLSDELPCRIERIWYINPYGQEISPAANPKATSVLRDAEAVIYSIGSLYTSIIPCLILRGIGEALVSTSSIRHKILILNGSIDRETGPTTNPMDATDFIAAIARAGEESRGIRDGVPDQSVWRRYVTHLIYLEGEGSPKVDKQALANVGVDCVRCWARKGEDGTLRYDGNGLVGALEAILGRGERMGERSRRNTLES